MIVFLDSNLILDVMLENSEFYDESNKILSKCNDGFDFYISAASCTDIYYILRKAIKDRHLVKQIMNNLLKAVSVAGVDELCIKNALESDWIDFEDAVQHEVAQQIRSEIIVTRNISDYKNSSVRVMTPSEFLSV